MSNAALARIDVRPPDVLPDLAVAVAQVEQLVADGAADTLNEARIRAEAHALYEARAENDQRVRHFEKLKLLAEAGLGCLSWDDPAVIPTQAKRVEWRALAAGFERGVLLELGSAYAIRQRGFTRVPGSALGRGPHAGSIYWGEARLLARERGIDPKSLPSDIESVKRRERAQAEQAKAMHRLYEARRRLDRMQRQKAIAAATKERGPRLETAYGYLRSTLQALHDAQSEFTREERADFDFDYLFERLYSVEDELGNMLLVPTPAQLRRVERNR